jgi:hypothetical protein
MTDIRHSCGPVENRNRQMSDITVDLWKSKEGLMSAVTVNM